MKRVSAFDDRNTIILIVHHTPASVRLYTLTQPIPRLLHTDGQRREFNSVTHEGDIINVWRNANANSLVVLLQSPTCSCGSSGLHRYAKNRVKFVCTHFPDPPASPNRPDGWFLGPGFDKMCPKTELQGPCSTLEGPESACIRF